MIASVNGFVSSGGYAAIFLLVGLECIGLPLPGETALIAAGIIAGTTHRLSVEGVVVVAALAGIVGSSAGYWLGRTRGAAILTRFGPRVGLTARRLEMVQALFARRGAWIVSGGRFVSVVRTYVPLIAGTSRMALRPFMIANVLGAIVWSCTFGIGAYALGDTMRRVSAWVGLAIGALVLLLVVLVGLAVRHSVHEVEDRTEPVPGETEPPEAAE